MFYVYEMVIGGQVWPIVLPEPPLKLPENALPGTTVRMVGAFETLAEAVEAMEKIGPHGPP